MNAEEKREYHRRWRAAHPKPKKEPPTLVCPTCGSSFVRKGTRQTFCSRNCWEHGPKCKAKKRRRVDRLKIATAIRNEVLRLPTKESKMLWDGVGRWARDYDQCEECQTTVYRYFSNGLCRYCYNRLRVRSKDQIAKIGSSSPEGRKDRVEWLKKVEAGEVKPETPTIANLLKNLEKVKSGRNSKSS